MKYTICFLMLLLMVSLPACKKVASEGASSDYYGVWQIIDGCPIGSITIYEDSKGCLHEDDAWSNEGCHFDACGNIVVGPSYFYIGSLRFKIVDPIHRVDSPYYNYSGYYEMRLKKPFVLGGFFITLRKYFI